MRLWHYELLPYLPELQFKGQLRELVLIMHNWKNKGTTNHLLINKVMEYERNELVRYFEYYNILYHERYGKWVDEKYYEEFQAFKCDEIGKKKYYSDDWHTEEYLRSNMANLWEKHTMGVGKSRISDDEWQRLVNGYKQITEEDYKI